MESHHDLISLFEHDLRANALRVCREGKPVSTFPDHALSILAEQLAVPPIDEMQARAGLADDGLVEPGRLLSRELFVQRMLHIHPRAGTFENEIAIHADAIAEGSACGLISIKNRP